MRRKCRDYQPPKLKRKAIVQGHCHHKAIMRMENDESVMHKMGLDYQVLNSGCCGMAGSFGFEADKYEVSIACGERALFPAVRNAGISTMIVADGFSCKEQIEQDTPRHALHLAEVMQIALHQSPGEATWMYPEQNIVAKRTADSESRWREPHGCQERCWQRELVYGSGCDSARGTVEVTMANPVQWALMAHHPHPRGCSHEADAPS